VVGNASTGLFHNNIVVVNGLAAQTQIRTFDAADALHVQGLDGDDIVDASGYVPVLALALEGGAGKDTLIGSSGNDTFTGGADDDTFVYAPGGKADIVTDFTADSNVDKINLKAFANLHSFADVLALASQVGTSTVLNFGAGDTLTLQHVTKTNLDAGDFLLNGPAAAALTVTTSGAGIIGGNGDLNAGDTVTLTLAFDGAVTVAGGVPTLTLNDGGVATYSGGSGSTALTFQYTVASGQNTADLAVTAIDRHGATLHDANGNDADLANAVTNPAGILKIDTLAPQVNAVSATPATGNETAGSMVTFTVTLNEAVNVAGGTPTLSLNDGGIAQYDAAATAALHDPTKLVFDYLVSAADTPVASLAITGIDRHGAIIADLATNATDFGNLATTFTGLSVNQSGVDPHGIAAPPHLADFFLV
jgi:hypothetical protein